MTTTADSTDQITWSKASEATQKFLDTVYAGVGDAIRASGDTASVEALDKWVSTP